MPEMLELAKLLSVMPATNAITIISAMKHIKTFCRITTTENRLNHHIILHVHWGRTDQPNMEEVAKDFKSGNQAL